MEAVMKSEIFFFVATIAVVVITVVIVIVAVRFFKVLGIVKVISLSAKEEVEKIKGNVDQLREHFKTEGLRLVDIVNFFQGSKKPNGRKSRITKK